MQYKMVNQEKTFNKKTLQSDKKKTVKRKTRKKKPNKNEKTEPEEFMLMGRIQQQRAEEVQRVLPHWISHPTVFGHDLRADGCPVEDITGLNPALVAQLKLNRISRFFPVQRFVIPLLLQSCGPTAIRFRPRDLCVSAPTGSGKTLAYVLPIIQALMGRVIPRIRALVLLPVQQLAEQVFQVFRTYAAPVGLSVGQAIGAKVFSREQADLVESDGKGKHNSLVDILVATPGRLKDHIGMTEGLDFSHVRYLVLDEADTLQAGDGGEWIARIEQAVNKACKELSEVGSFPLTELMIGLPTPVPMYPVQRLLFSATLCHDPESLQQRALYQPRLLAVKSWKDEQGGKHGTEMQSVDTARSSVPENYVRPAELVEQYVVVDTSLKPLMLHHLILKHSWRKTLVFTHGIEATHKLALLLEALADGAYVVAEFSSKLGKIRRAIMQKFKKNKFDVLVSTDALARGLDIAGIENVVSYDHTNSPATYIHRVGRTARAGKEGRALTMLPVTSLSKFKSAMGHGAEYISQLSVDSSELDCYEEEYHKALDKLKQTLHDEKQRVKERQLSVNAGAGRSTHRWQKASYVGKKKDRSS